MNKRLMRRITGLFLAALLAVVQPVGVFAEEIDIPYGSYEDISIEEAVQEAGDGYTDEVDITSEQAGETDDMSEPATADETAGETAIEDEATIPEEGEDPSVTYELSDELPYGLMGMPDGYTVSASEMEDKLELNSHGIGAAIASMEPGTDYVEDEVIFLAEDEGYADDVAAAYNGTLESFEYGVAVVKLDEEITVVQAVSAGMDTGLNLPPVEPNYLTYLEPVEDV
ncbi:MAG: hypothetical protein K6F34_02090, partial [Lachnospiraceae bacterium]|nr:hypothetical protein [Lachnospiraceae bacterium]